MGSAYGQPSDPKREPHEKRTGGQFASDPDDVDALPGQGSDTADRLWALAEIVDGAQ
jgi:hypothetical protein